MPYKIVNLEQGTDAWHVWRRQGLGASDAPTVMGENPWKTREELFLEKKNGTLVHQTHVMRRGIRLEPEARQHYETATCRRVTPQCLQSSQHDWLIASVDGMTSCRGFVVEIKCGTSAYSYSKKTQKVPKYYYAQLQHILAVTNLDTIDYWSYQPKCSPIHIVVERDLGYISRMLEVEEKFWKKLKD